MATILDTEPVITQREATEWLGKRLRWENRLADLRRAANVPTAPPPATVRATADAA